MRCLRSENWPPPDRHEKAPVPDGLAAQGTRAETIGGEASGVANNTIAADEMATARPIGIIVAEIMARLASGGAA